jgi:Ca2+-binding EF-hand superfamily protein
MKRTFFVAVGLIVCLAAFAADGPAEKADDSQDVLYLGEGRPALLRLHLQVQGKPVFAAWEAWMRKLFAFLDRNGTGTLERLEAAKAPNAAQLLQFLQGDIATIPGRVFNPSVPFEQLDANRDGKVEFDEFADYYKANGSGPVRVATPGVNAGGQDNLTNIVFGILDADKDGRLSADEVANAERLFLPYDTDDDEQVSFGELGYQRPQDQQRQMVLPDGMMQQPQEPNTKMMLIPRIDGLRGSARLQVVRDIIAKLDKDKSGKLSQAESAFPAAGFAKLDRNRDGQLDVLELSRWLTGKPDGEFTVAIGSRGGRMMVPGSGGPESRPTTLGRGEEMSLKLENVRLLVLPVDLGPPRLGDLVVRLNGQFTVADKDKRNFLIKRGLDANQFTLLVNLFDIADRNNDGKLTRDELKEFGGLYQGAYGTQLSLTLRPEGLGMFQTLDTNHDERLGVRELRTAWGRLREFDRDGDGFVTKLEFPQQFAVQVSPDSRVASPEAVIPAGEGQRGPLWFRKMDRNGDGDVSRVEWLGAREDFDRMDTDRDGLVSAAEADAFDVAIRKKSN